MLLTTRQEKRAREKALKTVYTFQCDVCTKQFETNINGKVRAKQKNHYCSQDCVKTALKNGGVAQNNMRETCLKKYGAETVYEHMNKTRNMIPNEEVTNAPDPADEVVHCTGFTV